MRTGSDICLLCKKNLATQRKSHVIPKFFGDGIFYGTKPRHGISIDRTGQQRKIQDITKVDFMICPGCEKGISIFESYCILRLERFNQVKYFGDFKNHKIGNFQFFECNKIDIRIFNLFMYSVVWRLSVTDQFEFQKFKLPQDDEETLREIITKSIFKSQNELIDNLNDVATLSKHSHVILRPIKKLRPPRSMMSAASLDQETHQICLVDYLIIYLTNQNKLVPILKEIDNNNLERLPRIGLSGIQSWESFNNDLLNRWTS